MNPPKPHACHDVEPQRRRIATAIRLAVLALCFRSVDSQAISCRVDLIPIAPNRCGACHVNEQGGGTRNAFGADVEKFVVSGSCSPFWNVALAALDSDGDGFTNGEELGDPDGDGAITPGATITLPGSAADNPIQNKMPIVTLTGPANNATLPPDLTFRLTANAADTDGSVTKVEFFDGTVRLGESTQAPHGLSVRLLPGLHGLTALATDDRKGSARSATVSIRVSSPSAMKITGIQLQSQGQVRISWEGGIGPFVLQQKPVLTAPAWQNLPAVSARTTLLPAPDAAGFLRVTDLGQVDSIPFTVALSGAAQRPDPVATEATGSAILRLDGDRLTFEARAVGLSNEVTGVTLRGPAGVNEAGERLLDLQDFRVGSLSTVSGSTLISPEQKAGLVNGQVYLSFDTISNPSGAIRGQVAPVVMQAVMLPIQVRPGPGDSRASGIGSFRLVGNQLTFNISYRGLATPANVTASLRGPAAPGTRGASLFALDNMAVGTPGVSGAFAGSLTLPPETLAAVIEGRASVEIANAEFPDGAIRGQIRPHASTIPLGVVLSGEAERPKPVISPGLGIGLMELESDRLSLNLAYAGLAESATTLKLHGSSRSTNTAVALLDLSPLFVGGPGREGTLVGTLTLTASQLSNVKGGLTYLNLSTPANPTGELRGQLVPAVMKSSLNNASEVGGTPLPSLAKGSGMLLVVHQRATLQLSYSGLTSAATAAHLHGPASTSASAPVLIDLGSLAGDGFDATGSLAGAFDLSLRNLGSLVDGATYLNIHTTGNRNGEIRGQVVR